MDQKYLERVDRNLGVISLAEQQVLSQSCVAVAGCGGMGGYVAAALARVGVKHIRIADNQTFDLSNLNRQFAAKISTIGENKAIATFREISGIADDVQIDVFTEGVNEKNVETFIQGADIICDEIEFYELSNRIRLHQAARKFGIEVLNCNVVGWGSRIFLFTPTSMTIEEFLDADERTQLDESVIWRLVKRFAPDLPEDISDEILREWVFKLKKVPIFGGTPLISSGILVDRLVLQLIGCENRPWIEPLPPMPAYGLFDAGKFKSYIHHGEWW